ncbi:hypothetical protein PV433_07850 [Paenibacillus sp. GYB004]|uniref:hypothetical protein n=1 Tax=Paenibacillus sp. GYB004 TaxID=2994393 RepID=UPI002F96B8D0
MASFRRTLANMLRAGFPLIHVRTWEEDRTLETIKQIASNDALIKTSRHLYTWNLLETDDGNGKTNETKPKSLLDFLGRIELITWPAIIVVYDIHSFFTSNTTEKWAQERAIPATSNSTYTRPDPRFRPPDWFNR